MYVMKVVDIVTKNSDQLSLYFSDFSENLYRLWKTKRNKRNVDGPLDSCGKPSGILKIFTGRSLGGG